MRIERKFIINISCIKPAHILLPKKEIDPGKWAVIACDQFTAEPEYWNKVEEVVGDSPSTLRMILPEIYLEKDDVSERIQKLNDTMKAYLANGIFQELPVGMMLTARKTSSGCPRLGIVMAFDLEAYSFQDEDASIIPTEKTVVERIPARVKVREGAALELPHIMILINDPSHSVIDPIYENRDALEKQYDFDLMQEGGHLTGWFLPKGEWTDRVTDSLKKLPENMLFAVGDGNHSLAAAKTNWERIKKELSPEEQKDHPARFVLAELVNLYDESILIEGIHRVLFDADPGDVLEEAKSYFASGGASATIDELLKDEEITDEVPAEENALTCRWYAGDREGSFTVKGSKWTFTTAAIQSFLDHYLSEHPEVSIDYIHGEDTVKRLSSPEDSIGFVIPGMDKAELFNAFIHEGVLPRKTFSMGEAREKRYYMEARKITIE